MKIFNQVICFVVFFCTAPPLLAGVITSLTLIEKEGVSTNNYPLTFGHVFKQGDVTSGIVVRYNGSLLTTQFDKKTSWPDGSVKIGVISVIIPTVTANGAGTITIETAANNSSTGAMDKVAILSTNVESNINLSNLNGSGYSGSVSSSLRDQINSGELEYWLQGAICTEILETQLLNNSLNSAWEARFYPGTSFGIRISSSVENVNILYRGNVGYDVTILQGESSPSTVYTKTGFTHLHGSRWRKVFWLGTEPPETELHYDLPYLISTGAVMPYDMSLTVPESALASEYSAWLASPRDIGDNGLIYKTFGTTGGRRELGILPRWSVMYLLTMDNRMKEMVIGHADISGHVPRVHWRETDATKTNYGGVVTIDDRVTYNLSLDYGGEIPAAIGSIDKGGWEPDRSHMGSFSYLPYLITGEYWHLKETEYWGAYSLSFHDYGRNGAGNVQNYSSGKDASYGLIYDQARGVAWGLRAVSDALFVMPDIETGGKAYFLNKLNNNIEWLKLANQNGKHGVHAFRGPREQVYSYPWVHEHAPWQHDFNILTLRHIINQKHGDQTKLSELLTYLGYFTIGRFSNHPTFNKWDGTGYWWPLSANGGTTYYNEGDWAGYWSDVLGTDGMTASSQGLPHSDFSRYNYADSYLAIGAAALACIPGGDAAYTFARSNITTAALEINPTWAITSSSFNKSIKTFPVIFDIK